MNKNNLPKYWAVQNDGSQLFKDTVIKYLNELENNNITPWKGVNKDYYYGYDGRMVNKGTTCTKHISEFDLDTKLLTLEEFIKLTSTIEQPFQPKKGDWVMYGDNSACHGGIYITTIEGAEFPHLIVKNSDIHKFLEGKPYEFFSWRFIAPSNKRAVTIAQIEKELGYEIMILTDER